jgi:hypothetical protein
MNTSFNNRLNKILPIITSSEFLSHKGLGNEIPFHVFDYPPEEELIMREHVVFLINYLKKNCPHIKFLHINLFEAMVLYLQDRKVLEKSFTLESQKGSKALWKALSALVQPQRFVKVLEDKYSLKNSNLILLSGVGTIWPWVRAHSLLNNLQSVTGNIPLLLFYPGKYTGQSFQLFGRLKSDNYYRAFRLIP